MSQVSEWNDQTRFGVRAHEISIDLGRKVPKARPKERGERRVVIRPDRKSTSMYVTDNLIYQVTCKLA